MDAEHRRVTDASVEAAHKDYTRGDATNHTHGDN
jgi:hypothetical protein